MNNNCPEVIIIGSGVGGLCCGALLAKAGFKVLVLEAHSKPGGAAHGFKKKGYSFESGPSLWSGLNNLPTNNPLGQILKIIGAEIEIIKYSDWRVLIPEGDFQIGVGKEKFNKSIKEIKGDKIVEEWTNFTNKLEPISKAANSLPLLTLNQDFSNIFSLVKRSKNLIPHINSLKYLSGSFSEISNKYLKDPFLNNWVDLLCFLISGLPKEDTNAAAMATLFEDWFKKDAYLEYPKGGSETIVNALVKGIVDNGGQVKCNSKVDQIICSGQTVSGVRLASGDQINAQHIVSNADIWQTINLLPKGIADNWINKKHKTPKCSSFLHIHIGFDAQGLEDLPIHTIWVNDWKKKINSDRNISVLSIPSVLDKNMAPEGKHVLHGYTPANEPWEIWKNLKYGDSNYEQLKNERCQIFFKSIEKIIPDIKERIEVEMYGTPLTHNKYLNATDGSYGPALSASKGLFPGNKTPIKNLLLCGSSTFPGIGIPPVAASGAFAAFSITGKKISKELLNKLSL